MNFTFYDQYQPVKPSFTGKQLSIGGTICEEQIYSKYIFERARKVNIYFSTLIIVVGIIGNALALFVFSQKKFRVNSSSVYMLCLALSDGLFLLTHFFEDTLRTYIDLYVNKNINVHEQCRNHSYFEVYNISKECESNLSPHSQRFIRSLNITDRFDFFCVLFNYFRYFLRFLSAYIIVAFTINRVITMYRPVSEIKLESKKITWTIISVIVFLGLISNIWVPFLFRTEVFSGRTGNLPLKYCDIRTNYQFSYFTITLLYIFIVMLIPIIVIFVCNSLIIFRIVYASKQRKMLLNESYTALKSNSKIENQVISTTSSCKSVRFQIEMNYIRQRSSEKNTKLVEPAAISVIRQANTVNRKSIQDTKINTMLMFMSFSYALLNLPYFITWMIFFHQVAFITDPLPTNKTSHVELEIIKSTQNNHFFTANYIAEVLYVLNYGIHFFIYCASGKRFRYQLKYSFESMIFREYEQERKSKKTILKKRTYYSNKSKSNKKSNQIN